MTAFRLWAPSQADIDAGYILLVRLLLALTAARWWYLIWPCIRHEPLITLNVLDRAVPVEHRPVP